MIKYLGSKRRLVPVLEDMARVCLQAGAETALDLFCGTTRVSQAFKRAGLEVTAVDRTRAASTLAQCYVATDAPAIDPIGLAQVLASLQGEPDLDGYVTQTFCRDARFFTPENGRRIDAIRAAIEARGPGDSLRPVLLTSLIEAADRVDSTTGVQMAYLKQWAPRAANALTLRPPVLIDGPGHAVRGDAEQLAATLPPVDLAYLDPPYNQHRYESNYHVWETVVAGDEPEHYGVAVKRVDLRDTEGKSRFNRKADMPDAFRSVVEQVRARVLVVSFSNEGWVDLDDLVAWVASRGDERVAVLGFPSRRYVGAQIGIHDPSGRKVGKVSHLENVEYLVCSGPAALVDSMVRPHGAAEASVGGRSAKED